MSGMADKVLRVCDVLLERNKGKMWRSPECMHSVGRRTWFLLYIKLLNYIQNNL